MKISGFTIIRNAINYDFPVVECIHSMLDLVDELVIALGDSSDNTDELINSIKSDKIKIIKTDWDSSKYSRDGQVYASQTDIALKACTGDWCLYLQADEVLHESAVPIIRKACNDYLSDLNVEGFLLRYVHFYADYDHFISARHFGYPKEVRIVRNLADVHSWRDAQSFRIIPNFDYQNYWQKEGTRVLRCILLDDAYIYHYGWCRDPRLMVGKKKEQNKMHCGTEAEYTVDYHDYGNLRYMPLFKGQHPKVMKDKIAAMSWSKYLNLSDSKPDIRKMFAPKYRILNFIENNFMRYGNRIFGFKNYKQIGVIKGNKK